MRVTIKDIARETKLSPTTVSIVLNNKPHRLSEETRQRVWEAAKRMNYRPNGLATSLKTRKTKTMGMIIPNFTNAYFGELARGAEAKCAEEGYSLILCNTNDSTMKIFDYINTLIDRGVDGIILYFDGMDTDEIKSLIDYAGEFGVLLVSVDYQSHEKHIGYVALDNKLGGYLATQYLIELGHTRIGCITGPYRTKYSSAHQRYIGYKEALSKAGIRYSSRLVVNGEYNIESGLVNAGKLYEQGVTGIIASNDLCAYGVYKWARDHGVIIPDGLSVVGYDDIVYSDFFSPRLTTIRQPAYHMGYEAAVKIIAGGGDGKSPVMEAAEKNTVFKPELIVRGSTAPVSRTEL